MVNSSCAPFDLNGCRSTRARSLTIHHSPFTIHQLMKYVVLLSGAECAPARGLGEALREAGLSFVAVGAGNGSHKHEAARIREEWEAEALAVLFDVAAGSEWVGLHARGSRAVAAWPRMAMD